MPHDLDLSALGFSSAEPNLARAFAFAATAAFSQGYDEIRSPHLLAGLAGLETGVLAANLRRVGLPAAILIAQCLAVVPSRARTEREEPGGVRKIGISSNLVKLLLRAAEHARGDGSEVLRERDVCAVLFADEQAIIYQILEHCGVTTLVLDLRPAPESGPSVEPAAPSVLAGGWDLTELAQGGELPPCVGRNAEIGQLLRLLAAPQPRVLLVGEMGVGESMLMVGVAQAIADQLVPSDFAFCRVVEIDLRAWLDDRLPGMGRLARALGEADSATLLFLNRAGSALRERPLPAEMWERCRGGVVIALDPATARAGIPGLAAASVISVARTG